MEKWYYYYLHVNGRLICKHPSVVDYDPLYFDSPFVVKYWLIDSQESYNAMMSELINKYNWEDNK